jgi:hypothetical protein
VRHISSSVEGLATVGAACDGSRFAKTDGTDGLNEAQGFPPEQGFCAESAATKKGSLRCGTSSMERMR